MCIYFGKTVFVDNFFFTDVTHISFKKIDILLRATYSKETGLLKF